MFMGLFNELEKHEGTELYTFFYGQGEEEDSPNVVVILSNCPCDKMKVLMKEAQRRQKETIDVVREDDEIYVDIDTLEELVNEAGYSFTYPKFSELDLRTCEEVVY